ncbi:hypothetical protein [Stetteria hydrogenophila]
MAYGLPEGVYVETIAVLCRGGEPAWSSPLGFISAGGRILFRVFRGSGFWRILVEEGLTGRIVAYTPRDPAEFALHVLEGGGRVESCRPVGQPFTIECTPELLEVEGDVAWFACRDASVREGPGVPYTRAYGCLVELAVLASKAKAGVLGGWALGYARGLLWCVKRSEAMGGGRYARLAERLLQVVEEALRGRG